MKNKIKLALYTILGLFLIGTHKIKAVFNEAAAKELVTSWTTPIQNFLIWLVPIATGISALVVIINFLRDDEEKREQKKLLKRLTPTIIGGAVGVSILTILAIFGM